MVKFIILEPTIKIIKSYGNIWTLEGGKGKG